VKSGGTFVQVPAVDFFAAMTAFGMSIEGCDTTQRRMGREVVYEFRPANSPAVLHVFTGISEGASEMRGCGQDAIRLVVCTQSPEGIRPLAPAERVFRTAPASEDSKARIQMFLNRLFTRMRAAYKRAALCPICAECGRPMALRETTSGQFFGCSGFPACRATRSVHEHVLAMEAPIKAFNVRKSTPPPAQT
jgi:hypothetical protein